MKKNIYSTSFFFFFTFCIGFTQTEVIITDASLEANQTYIWTSDNCYILDGFVFVEEGATLNIEAGTVIKAKESPSTNDNASALIIARGAKLNAVGTADAPIIFTSELDDVTDASDLSVNDRGLWGGLIILGKGVIANTTVETRIEGIPEGEARALFGGVDDADSSGELRYVSIRHGGAELAPGDEINGLTLGGVGSGTILENIEVLANQDDGIEFFGGTVNLKYASVSFCGDDAFDWDLGWRGKGQFWLALLGEDDGDNGGELDGAKPDDGEPTSNPTIYNATFIGAGCGASAKNATGLLFRDGSAGTVSHSVITDFNHALEVEDRASGLDSRQRMETGALVLANNIWSNFCNGAELSAGANGIIRATEDAEDATAQFLLDHLSTNGNEIKDHGMIISRIENDAFNPLSDALISSSNDFLNAFPTDDFFTKVCYNGAFGNGVVWLQNWTALASYGVLDPNLPFGLATEMSSCATSIEEIEIYEKGYSLVQNIPNPSTTQTLIEFSLPVRKAISLTVFNYVGEEVASLLDYEELEKGIHHVQVDVSNWVNGVYFYTLNNEEVVLTKQLVVLK